MLPNIDQFEVYLIKNFCQTSHEREFWDAKALFTPGDPVESGAGRGGCIMGQTHCEPPVCQVHQSLGYTVKDHGNLNRPEHIPTIDGPGHLVKLDDTVPGQRSSTIGVLLRLQDFPTSLVITPCSWHIDGRIPCRSRSRSCHFVLWLDAHPDTNTLTSTVWSPARHAYGLCTWPRKL